MTDYSAATIHQYTKVEVTDSTGAWVELPNVDDIKIDYTASVPFCTYTGPDNSDIIEDRLIRVSILTADSLTDAPIYSGQYDPIINSGDGHYSGETQPRFVADDSNVWFLGRLGMKKYSDPEDSIQVVTVIAKSYMKNLDEFKISDKNGYHYGSGVALTIESGITVYPLSEISDSLNDIYAVYIGSTTDYLVRSVEFTTWTYDHTSKELKLLYELPTDAVVVVYGHVDVDPYVIFDEMCEAAEIPTAYYSSTALAGSEKGRVWFPQGWTLLQCLNNLAEQIGYRVFTDRDGVVHFDPRPLSTESADVIWKDGAEADYNLLGGCVRTLQDNSTTKVRVEGAKWITSQYTDNTGLIADHADGSNIDIMGGIIEIYSNGTDNILTPDNGTFFTSYERDNRVAKLTGTLFNGVAGPRYYLSPTKIDVDISGFTGLQFDIRGNGQKIGVYLVDSSQNVLFYDLNSTDSYPQTIQIPFTSFSNQGAATTDISYILIAQYSFGSTDFAVDNVKLYPATAGDETRKTRRELLIYSEAGVTGGKEKVLGYYCLGSQEEALNLATATLLRSQTDTYDVACYLPHAQDPDTKINKIVAITTDKYSYTSEKFEIKNFKLNINSAGDIDFYYYVQTPLTPAMKTVQAQSFSKFALLSGTADVSDLQVVETYNDTVDTVTGQSLWNHNIIAPNDMTLISASADVSDSEVTMLFSKYPESVEASNLNNYEVQNISHGDDVSIVADVSDSSITATFDQTPGSANLSATDVNNYEALNIKPEIVSMVADVSLGTVVITFKEPLNEVDAKNINNYELLNIKETA